MPDSTHHDGDDGFHEIQLSGKQLVFLFMATTVVAVVIFLCGVQVGRNVRGGDHAADADALAASSSATPPAQAPPTVTTPPPAAEAPPPAKDSDEGLSYAKRLQSANTPKEQLKPQTPGEAKPPTPQPVPASTPPQTAAAVVAPPPSPAVSRHAPAPQPAAGPPQPGNWVVQVHALKDRGAAEGIAKSLIAKGYPAFVLDPDPGAPAIFRVQVGRYNDRHDAEQVARKLEANEHYKPIIHSAR